MASLAACLAAGPWRTQISAPTALESPGTRRSTRCAAARSEWRRGVGRRSPPPVPAPTLERGLQHGAAAESSATYSFALAQSIVRLHSTAEQLAAVAASEPASVAAAPPLPSRLQAVQLAHLGRPLPPHPVAAHGRGLFHEDTLMQLGALSSIDSSMCSSGSYSEDESGSGLSGLPPAEAHLQRWQAEAAAGETPGFNSQQRLTVPGLADVAVLSWGGRARNKWKSANQDAFAAAELESAAGGHPAALLVVCDGHGRGGEHASTAAARGLAEAVPQARSRLLQPGGTDGNSSGGGGGLPVAQEALIAAFQAVGAAMHAGFRDCGTAAVACLLEPHCVTAVWTGDCRAVAGLVVGTIQGPAVLVHQLTRDHKPESPLEHARIVATGRGRVVQLREGQSHRLCGYEATSQSIALSRALGDAWATKLGLTYEPDALSITLPNPAGISTDWAGGGSGSGSHQGAFATLGSSIRSTDAEGEAASGGSLASSSGEASSSSKGSRPARHVLVVASDGVWDMMSNEEAVGIALSCASPDEAAQALMQTTCRRWAAAFEGEFLDDITLAVAFLPA